MLIRFSNLLSEGDRDVQGHRIEILFSFGFSLLALQNQHIMNALLNFVGQAALVILAFFLLALALAVYDKDIPVWVKGTIYMLIMIFILYAAFSSFSTPSVAVNSIILETIFAYLIESGLLVVIIIFLILFLIIYWMTKPSKTGQQQQAQQQQQQSS